MDLSTILSEEKIKRAYSDGEFDHLPGFGKPLQLEDLSSVPEELRMAYKLMKNAGYTQEENQLRNEMMTLDDLIRNCQDPEEEQKLRKKLSQKLHRFNGMLSKRRVNTNSSIFKNYEQKIFNKMNL
ncbi:MAG: DUF1992 domain-containing protein [Bacillota bacterium]|nr:DUF1992 domain-containing protein [Bacillota bacterium]